MFIVDGMFILIDFDVVFGDCEFDLVMMIIFGGFCQVFYQVY